MRPWDCVFLIFLSRGEFLRLEKNLQWPASPALPGSLNSLISSKITETFIYP